MKLSLSQSKKLNSLLNGDELPYSQLSSPAINALLDDGILRFRLKGRSQKKLYVPNKEEFSVYLRNQMGINDLSAYIKLLENNGTRADSIHTGSDSKLSNTRTFKGFLINSLHPIIANVNSQPLTIHPPKGSFVFISDFETFRIPPETQIIGIENSENFRFIEKQAYLFPNPNTLFVSRYPQSGDLINWIKQIPNPYLHFGDFDFAGIRIFLNEYHKHLGDRSEMFIPENIENLLEKYGNRNLYEKQLHLSPDCNIPNISEVINILHKYGKCLEQEIFIHSSQQTNTINPINNY